MAPLSKQEAARKKREASKNGRLRSWAWRMVETKNEGTLLHWTGRFILDFVYGCLKDDPSVPFRTGQEVLDPLTEESHPETSNLRQWQDDALNNGGRRSDRKDQPTSIVPYRPRSEWPRRIGALAAVGLMAIAVTFIVTRYRNTPERAVAATAQLATTPSVPSNANPDMVAKTNAILKANGWPDESFKLAANVDESKDKSTAGDGAFTAKGIKNPATMVAFLKSNEDGAKALKASIMAATDATEDEVLDVRNWIAVQSEIEFTYPSNTSLHGAKVVNAGARGGSKGDIFLIFASPSSGKAVAVRGACGNAQVVVPRPVKFVPSRPGRPRLQPKVASDDPYPRGNALTGGGHNDQNGPGTHVPPNQMVHPPAAPRVNPAPPAADPAPPTGSTADPTPPPPPEPAAPTPEEPADGNVTPPGGGSI